VAPEGAFYLFPRITGLIDAIPEVENSVDACAWLLDNAMVALVPGSAFGAEGFLRLSYAASEEDLEKAVQRLSETAGNLIG